MGIGRSRRTGGLVAFGSSAAAALAVVAACAPAATSSPPKPTTIFQCQKKFKAPTQQSERTKCIKRVRSEKPGTSCKYPLFSGLAVDGFPSQNSDTKDFSVKLKVDHKSSPEGPVPGAMTTLQAEVIVHNPRIVICRVAVLEFKGNHTVYPLTIGAHGGLSSKLTIESRIEFGIAAYARLAAATPGKPAHDREGA